MRISDWSSDVCSSDLAVSPRNAASLALEGEIQLRSARGSIRAEPAFGIYRRALAAVSLERAAEETGIPAPDITSFAEMLTSAASACYYGWTGIGLHANATRIDRAVATLFALKADWMSTRMNSSQYCAS